MTKRVKLSLKEDVLRDLLVIENELTNKLQNIGESLKVARTPLGQIIEDPNVKDSRFGDANKKQFEELLKAQEKFTKELAENKKEQDKIFKGDFLKGLTDGSTKATAAIGGVTTAIEDTAKTENVYKKLSGEFFDLMSGIKAINNTAIVLPEIDFIPFKEKALTVAEQIGKEMGDALSSGLKSLAVEGLTQFGDFLGTVISGGDMTVKDFGKGLLDSLGKFMGQFGEAMIAMGIAQVMLDVAIKSFNPALAIIGGVALVAAGAAISNLSQKGMDTSGGSGGLSFSGSGGFSSMSGIGANMQPIVLDTRISGRDMIITQGRESQFKR